MNFCTEFSKARKFFHVSIVKLAPVQTLFCDLFNRDLNRGCLVYMFSLRFSESKFFINLRRQFRVRKIFSCT